MEEGEKETAAIPSVERVHAIAMAGGALALSWKLRHENEFDQRGCLPFDRKTEDSSPYTQADKQVNAYIREQLSALTPDIPVVAEENTPEENRRALEKGNGTYWCIDPIDGTSNFIAGSHRWGVLIGLVKDGMPVMGVAYYPEMHQSYYTNDEGKAVFATSAGFGRGSRERELIMSSMNTGLPLHVDERFMQSYAQLHKLPYGAQTIRSRRVDADIPPQRELMVARGDYDISFLPMIEERQTPCIWDSAAPMAILRAAGGEVFLHDGEGENVRKLEGGENSIFTCPAENLRMPPFLAGSEEKLRAHGVLSPHTKEPPGASQSRGR